MQVAVVGSTARIGRGIGWRCAIVLMATSHGSAVLACIPPPPVAPLPGEKPQAFEERQNAVVAAEIADGQRAVQTALLQQAKATFIGVVLASHEVQLGPVKGHELSVRPLSPIKGDLPREPVPIRDTVFTDCGLGGGGSATSAGPGDYVIVFAGLDSSDLQGANVGIRAKEALLPELRDALAIYARDNYRRPPEPKPAKAG